MFKSFFLICILVLGAAAQQGNSPILVDEFEKFGCCEFGSRLDAFMSELSNNPTNIGVIVTAGPNEKFVGKVLREEMTRSYIKYRNFDPALIRLIRAQSETVSTQLWRVPPGSAMPDLQGVDNTYNLDIDQPALLLTHYPSGDGGLCPYVENRDMFALILVANPTARGKVIIRGHNLRESSRIERDLTKFFLNEVEVDRSRVQFARVSRTDGAGFGPSIEYWYLP